MTQIQRIKSKRRRELLKISLILNPLILIKEKREFTQIKKLCLRTCDNRYRFVPKLKVEQCLLKWKNWWWILSTVRTFLISLKITQKIVQDLSAYFGDWFPRIMSPQPKRNPRKNWKKSSSKVNLQIGDWIMSRRPQFKESDSSIFSSGCNSPINKWCLSTTEFRN